MQSPIVNEQERHVLHALAVKGPMTADHLAKVCKEAFGWSAAVICRTRKSLHKLGLIQEQNGLLITTVSKGDLEDANWEQWVSKAFDGAVQAQAEVGEKNGFSRNIWFWATCAAAIVICVLSVILLTGLIAPEDGAPSLEAPTVPETSEPAAIAEELLICKEALDKWQTHDIYHMEHTKQYLAPYTASSQPAPLIYNWYYVHEKDWMHLCADWNNPDSMDYPSYMYRDGELLHAPNLKNQQWGPILHLSTIPSPDDYAPNPWPMTFNWENCELYHKKTLRYNYGSRVYCLIVDHSGEKPVAYEVEFAFDNFKNLYYIEMVTCDDSNQVCVETYVLKKTDPDMIAEVIANQGKDNPDEYPEIDTVPD